MNQRFGVLREDLQGCARLLRLIIHFELGNTSVLRYAVEAYRRFVEGKRTLQDFERVLLRFFSRVSVSPPSRRIGGC